MEAPGGGGKEAYDWYDFVLDSFGEGYYVEEACEVKLRDPSISNLQLGTGMIEAAHRRGQ